MDASCIVRILLEQAGNCAPLAGGTPVASSKIVEVETFRALDRARLTGLLDDAETAAKNRELSEFLKRLHLIPVSDEVIALARATFPVTVRAIDALHVATAQLLAPDLGIIEFWTHDMRQSVAAISRGLDVRGVPEP